MSFSVDPEHVRTFANKLENLSKEAPEATTYVGQHLDIGYADARLFATIAKACNDAREALEANYQGLERVAKESATETAKSATMYTNMDEDEARRLDDKY
ncbi:MAG: type VII secretion target [Haloechinothrix sp.]